MNLWRQICALEYVLSQGYSNDSVKDAKELNHLRFLYDRYLKIKKIKENYELRSR